jgi:capsular polysaccharide biosynthesis protein
MEFEAGKNIIKQLLAPLFLWKAAHPQDLLGNGVDKINVVIPAGQDYVGTGPGDDFLVVAKHHPGGQCHRPEVIVAELGNATLSIRSGMVQTRKGDILSDPGKEHRVKSYAEHGKLRPRFSTHLAGTYSTVTYCGFGNFWHWMVDCLPRILTLEKAYPHEAITILMPDSTNAWQRLCLARVAGTRFPIKYISGHTWLKIEKFIWPSLSGGECSAFLPNGYLQEIRHRIGAPVPAVVSASPRRIYITRRGARHRRVLNEDQLLLVLKTHGFAMVEPEKLSLDEQITLFRQAEIVMGPHGAGLAGAMFAKFTKLIVLYATDRPPNYFHSQCVVLGHRHYFLAHNQPNEDDDFRVDISSVTALVEKAIADPVPEGVFKQCDRTST